VMAEKLPNLKIWGFENLKMIEWGSLQGQRSGWWLIDHGRIRLLFIHEQSTMIHEQPKANKFAY
jgi:hypothetical protein